MSEYQPSDQLTKAVLESLLMPLPFFLGIAAKAIPGKSTVVQFALRHTVPASLAAIAKTQRSGDTVSITSHGELTEEVKQSMVQRIAQWLMPDEVQVMVSALQADIIRIAQERYAGDGWHLEPRENEVVLVVTDTSVIRVTAETAADIFFRSFEKLQAAQAAIMEKFKKKPA